MALGDWEFTATSQFLSSLELSSPLDGDGSLNISTNGTSANQAMSAVLSATTDPNRGHSRGRIRTLIRNVAGSSSSIVGGIFCLANDATWAQGVGSAYFANINAGNGDLNFNRTQSTTPTSGNIATFALGYTLGTTIGLELEWHNSLTDIGGIYFVVRTGVATDFSDLTDRIEVIEDIPAGNFNGYEGVFVLRDTGIETTWLFDKTSVFSIT